MANIANENKLLRKICRLRYQRCVALFFVWFILAWTIISYLDTPLQYPEDLIRPQFNSDGTPDTETKPMTVSSPLKNSKGENPSHECLNEDFKPKHKVSAWTMLNDNPSYVRGALKMGRGVKKYTATPLDLVVMELQSKPLTSEQWVDLHEVGFMKCVVESIPAPAKTRSDLKEKFAVLHVWAMVIYDTVLFLDADTLVVKSLDSLLNLDLQNKSIGVTKDIRERKWVSTFNSGVLLLHPSLEEYKRLRDLLTSGIVFEYIMSDQGFLNEVYKNDWHEIGFVNNANLALYKFQRKFWDEHSLEQINVIHYTMKKPWKCKANDAAYGNICKIWVDAD